MPAYPEKLESFLRTMDDIPNEVERSQVLVDYAEKFTPVPEDVAKKPYSDDHRVRFCESEAYVWSREQPDHTLKFYFAVENPSGISAKALAFILDSTLSGEDPDRIAAVPMHIVERIFRQNISMGKGMGLMSMVNAVAELARKHLGQRTS